MLSEKISKVMAEGVVYTSLGIAICLSLPLVVFDYFRYGLVGNPEPSFDNYKPLQWR